MASSAPKPRSSGTGALAFALVWSLWLGPLVPSSAAWCRASVETSPLADCEEVPGVPLLRWARGCVRYGFHGDLFDRVPGLTEQQIRADFEAAFAAYRDVDCGRSPFEVQPLQAISGAERAEFNWDVENESLIAARTGDEWTALEYDGNAIALTLLFFDPDNGEIYDADMELNAGIGELIHCEQRCASGEVDLPSTVIHEAGHYLGLGHSKVAGSTMSSHADVGNLDKRTLEDDDRDGYCALELPEPDQEGDAASCEAPVFPQFVKVERPASNGSGCAVSSLRAPTGSRALVLGAITALAATLMLRRRRRARPRGVAPTRIPRTAATPR